MKLITFTIAAFICILLILLVYHLFTRESVYKASLSRVADTYINVRGNRTSHDAPYAEITNDNFIHWDARYYHIIKKAGYDSFSAGGDYIYAFFPLYPTIWRITNLPNTAMLFFNYLLFAIGLFVLLKIFSSGSFLTNTIIALSVPGLAVFLIPYTEATFFAVVALGIYGHVRKKYLLYFLGFLLAAITRPTFTILTLAIICSELFLLIDKQYYRQFARNLLLKTAPLLTGTILVSLYQLSQGSGSFFKFVEVQKYWDHVFALPNTIKDWSHEGFGINSGVLAMIFLPLLIFILTATFIRIRNLLRPMTAKTAGTEKNFLLSGRLTPRSWVRLVSVMYLIGTTLFVLLYRGGSLHCFFRFTICTPFFFVVALSIPAYVSRIKVRFKLVLFAALTLAGIATITIPGYYLSWTFSYTGFIILAATLALWLFRDFDKTVLYRTIMFANFGLNIIWTTYLISSYVNNAWIFA